MFDFVFLFHLLIVAGICYFAVIYAFGPVPNAYQGEILQKETTVLDGGLLLVMTSLYRTAGFALFAACLGYLALAVGAAVTDLLWAKVIMLVMALAVGGPVAMAANRAEAGTGVQTPWRAVVGLTVAAILAFIISVI